MSNRKEVGRVKKVMTKMLVVLGMIAVITAPLMVSAGACGWTWGETKVPKSLGENL